MAQAVFYHAGCPVCVEAEQVVVDYLDAAKVEVEIVHLGTAQGRIEEAEKAGVQSVPALVINDSVYHINFGASLADVKG